MSVLAIGYRHNIIGKMTKKGTGQNIDTIAPFHIFLQKHVFRTENKDYEKRMCWLNLTGSKNDKISGRLQEFVN